MLQMDNSFSLISNLLVIYLLLSVVVSTESASTMQTNPPTPDTTVKTQTSDTTVSTPTTDTTVTTPTTDTTVTTPNTDTTVTTPTTDTTVTKPTTDTTVTEPATDTTITTPTTDSTVTKPTTDTTVTTPTTDTTVTTPATDTTVTTPTTDPTVAVTASTSNTTVTTPTSDTTVTTPTTDTTVTTKITQITPLTSDSIVTTANTPVTTSSSDTTVTTTNAPVTTSITGTTEPATATTPVTTSVISVVNTTSQGNVITTPKTATTDAKTTPQVTVTQENSTVQVITTTTAASSPTTASPYNRTTSVDQLSPNVTLRFTIKFNENFSHELENTASTMFQNYSSNYKEQLISAFNESAGFQEVFIVKFWQGSIGVDYVVQYNYGHAANVTSLTKDLTEVLNKLRDLTGVDESYVNTTTAAEFSTVNVQLNRIKDDPCSIPNVCRLSEQCTYHAQEKTVTCTHPCISLACGSGGQCVLNDAGQPQCRCKVEGDYVYAGETCGEKVEKLQLSSAQIIGVAAGVGGGLVLVLTLALLVMCLLRRKESKKQTWKGKDAVEPDYPSGDYKEDEPPLLMESFKRLSNTPESELPSSPLKNGGQGLKQSQRQEALPNIHGYTNRGYETSEDLLQNVRGESRSPGRQTGDYLMLEPEVNGLPHVYRTLEDGSYIYGGRSSLPRPTFTSPTRQSRKTRTEADGDPTTERSGFPSAEDGRWMPSPARFGSDGSPLENSMRKNMKRVDGSSLDRLSAVYNFSESHDLAGRQDDLDPYTSGANPSRGLRPETRQSARSQNYTYIDNQRY